ncbi:hypothetical protein [Deinococcus aquaedulcis]|uniref:hypothetical protein n=1 Tax=Deinococcus aquaedulcis TaxID=2840455 RepID=UPI001C82E4B3|nr:hypothetical protein [Deinococcus aquaedulcis]
MSKVGVKPLAATLLIFGAVCLFLGTVYFSLDAVLTMAYYSNSEKELGRAVQRVALCGLGVLLSTWGAVMLMRETKS